MDIDKPLIRPSARYPKLKFPSVTPTLGLLGAGIHHGQPHKGVAKAPKVFREFGIKDWLRDLGWPVNDFGNIECSPNTEQEPFLIYRNLYEQMIKVAQYSDFSLVLGGDHSIAFSTVAGLLEVHHNLGVIWVDAHGDINTPFTSPSGHLHGMPLAGLLGLIPEDQIGGFTWVKRHLDPSKIVLIGPRDLDMGERGIIEDLNIKMYTDEDIQVLGMQSVVNQAIDYLGPQTPIHLSFDVDAVNPWLAPATGCRVAGGLQLEDIESLGFALRHSGQLVSAEFVELNPDLAEDEAALQSTLEVFFRLMSELMPITQSDEALFEIS